MFSSFLFIFMSVSFYIHDQLPLKKCLQWSFHQDYTYNYKKKCNGILIMVNGMVNMDVV